MKMALGGADENTHATVTGLNGGRYVIDLMVGANSELDNFSFLNGKNVFIVEDLVRDISPLKDSKKFFHLSTTDYNDTQLG